MKNFILRAGTLWLLVATLTLGALALGGCGLTPQGDAVATAIKEQGSQAYDEGLLNSQISICHAASIGSIKRPKGTSNERAKEYAAFCLMTEAESDIVDSSVVGGGAEADHVAP